MFNSKAIKYIDILLLFTYEISNEFLLIYTHQGLLHVFHPNGQIFVDSLLIRRQNSMRKVCQDFINFERRIRMEIVTSIRSENFDVDLTFKIDEILMISPLGFFYVALTSNRCNYCIRCFYSIIS